MPYPKRYLFSLLCLAPLIIAAPAYPAGDGITLIAGGDILFTPHLTPYTKKHGLDHPFLAVREILQKTDAVFANLEVPLTDRGEPMPGKGYTYRASPRWAPVLARNGFNLLSLANNHILDFGPRGLSDTIDALAREKIRFTGAGENIAQARRAARLEIKGVKVACLAYSLTYPKEFYAGKDKPGTAFAYKEYLNQDIPALREEADIIIVSFHWGGELRSEPKEYQIKLAKKAIDLGAHIILGHHPHILQGIGSYKGRPIAYSLGNLAFSTYSGRVKESMLLRLRVKRNGETVKAEVIPLSVDNYRVKFQPTPLSGKKAAALLCDLDTLSQPLGGEITVHGDLGAVRLHGK